MLSAMIVDDEYWVRISIREQAQWEDMGIDRIYEAKDGKEAIEAAIKNKPDIMIIDMRMPVMDGRELLNRICEQLPDTKVIVLSGYSDFNYMQEAVKCGAFSYLLKPVKTNELNDTLFKAVSKILKSKNDKEQFKILNDEYVLSMRNSLMNRFLNDEMSDEEFAAYAAENSSLGLYNDQYLAAVISIDSIKQVSQHESFF